MRTLILTPLALWSLTGFCDLGEKKPINSCDTYQSSRLEQRAKKSDKSVKTSVSDSSQAGVISQ